MSIPPSSPSTLLHEIDEAQTLIPGLPNDVAALILSFLPYSHHCRLKPTCKPWYLFLSSKTLFSLRRHNRRSHLLCIFPEDPHISSPFLFDPEHLAWCPLPPMPCNPHEYGLCNFTSISLGPHIYVLGGSLFDTRSFPLDRPSPSSSAFRYNFVTSSWNRLAPMISPRGSFACAAIPTADQIIVAGGGSRHTMFRAAGSRICSVERYDVEKDQWEALDGLPRFRAGCVGFTVRGDGEEREFWVMGGYGDSRTVSGMFPVDEYYKDALEMELKKNKGGPKRGLWKAEEDMILKKYVETHGEGNWATLSKRSVAFAGLKRGGKSCRLRWKNYLRPNIKRGEMSKQEQDLIIRMHKLLGNRWSLIAGRLPGRTDNEVKNYWNTHLNKKTCTVLGKRKSIDHNNNNTIDQNRDGNKSTSSADNSELPIISSPKTKADIDKGSMDLDDDKKRMKQVTKEDDIVNGFTDNTWMERTIHCFNYDYYDDYELETPFMMMNLNSSNLGFDEEPFTPCLDSFLLFDAFGTDSEVGSQSFLP